LLYSGMLVEGKDVINNYASNVNKFLHKKDILWAKSEGFSIYDFGGVSPDDDHLSGINDFKLGFSKTIEKTYNYYSGNTVLGKFVLFMSRVLKVV
jgi:lipid II:glycine glycyltransferase (peptidoglycan interpeptide bridge formation enzyme)